MPAAETLEPNHGPTLIKKHSFRPGEEVRIWPVNREIGSPFSQATVKPGGELEVTGLSKGKWVAVGPAGQDLRLEFTVK